MEPRLKSYLRVYRRRWGLTQAELAYLLDIKSGTVLSRIETLKRRPSLVIAFGCRVLFGVPSTKLFPGLFSDIEEAVMRRAYELYEELQGDTSPATKTKLDFLQEALARARRGKVQNNV